MTYQKLHRWEVPGPGIKRVEMGLENSVVRLSPKYSVVEPG